MLERAILGNEIISLALLLLMVMALVASQADATIAQEVRAASTMQQFDSREMGSAPVKATIEAHIDGLPLTISIDTTAEVGYARRENH